MRPDAVRKIAREKMADWRARNPEKAKALHRRSWDRMSPGRRKLEARKTVLRRHKLTLEGYAALLEFQDGRCVICKRVSEKPLVIDHNHQTGEIRALLCGLCNVMLGAARDDSAILERGAMYLQWFR